MIVALAVLCASLAWGAGAAAAEERRYVVVLEASADKPATVAQRHARNEGARVRRVLSRSVDGYSALLSAAEAKAIARRPGVAAVGLDPVGKPAAQTNPVGARRVFAADSDCNPADKPAVNQLLFVNCLDDVRVDVDVAVLDTAIDPNHPDLNVVANVDCYANDPTPNDDDPTDHTGCPAHYDGTTSNCSDDHGQSVAQTIAGIDNGIAGVGVAPGARIWSVGVGHESNPNIPGCNPMYLSDLIAAVEWVTDHATDIEVANMSLQFPVPTDPAGQALDTALEDALDDSIAAGVVYVAAAGNSSQPLTTSIPAKYPKVITTTAIADYDGLPGGLASPQTNCNHPNDHDDTNADATNYGPAADPNTFTSPGADIAAPGPCTSNATAHTTGAAAILASTNNPNNTTHVANIRNTLLTTGNTNTKTNGGWDDETGTTKEPLLDVGDETAFDPQLMPGLNGDDDILGLDALSLTHGVVDVYARSENNTLMHKRFAHGWSGWTDLGGDVGSTPGVVNRAGTLVDVFMLDSTGKMNQLWYHPSVGWSSWGPSYGPTFLSSPDPVSRYSGFIDLYALGAGNTLQGTWFADGVGWSPWYNQTGTITSASSSISRYTGYLDQVARGSSGNLTHRWHNPGTGWSDWVSIGSPTGVTATSAPAVASRLDGDLDIFVRASDNAIWRKSWVANVGWSSWSSLGGSWAAAPAVVSSADEELSLFAVTGSGDLYWNRQSSSGWTGWQLTR